MTTQTPTVDLDSFTVTVGDEQEPSDFSPAHVKITATISHATGGDLTTPFNYNPESGDPTGTAILRCIADDATAYENAPTLESFMSELGYFPVDSVADFKRAESAFESCKRSAAYFDSCGVDVFDMLNSMGDE